MAQLKQLFKTILETEILLKASKGNRFIFVYHDISNKNSAHFSQHYSTPINLFIEHINLLDRLFEIISLDEIVTNENLNQKKNYAAITFDDGFYSVLLNAHPILKKKKIPYTIFANVAAIKNNQLWVSNLEILKNDIPYKEKLHKLAGLKIESGNDSVTNIMNQGKFDSNFKNGYKSDQIKNKTYLDESDIRLLNKEEGVDFGNHSYDHFVLSATENACLKDQINISHSFLSRLTNKKIKHFAIPFGKKEHYNNLVINELKNPNNYFIYSTNPNKFNSKNLNTENFIYPRIGIVQQTSNELLFYINRSLLKTYHL